MKKKKEKKSNSENDVVLFFEEHKVFFSKYIFINPYNIPMTLTSREIISVL